MVGFGNFDQSYEVLDSPVERLTYLWTLIHEFDDDPDYRDKWEERLGRFCSVRFDREFFNYRHSPNGYVDDGYRKGDLLKRLWEDDELLKRFIRGDAYVVIYDNNDEYIPGRFDRSSEDDLTYIYVS